MTDAGDPNNEQQESGETEDDNPNSPVASTPNHTNMNDKDNDAFVSPSDIDITTTNTTNINDEQEAGNLQNASLQPAVGIHHTS